MRKMFNLKRIIIMTILCGFLSVVGLSFDVYAGSNGEEQEEQPAQDAQSTQNTEVSIDTPAKDYSACTFKALEMYVSVEDTTKDKIIESINSHFGEANWSVTDTEVINEVRRLAETEYALELKPEYASKNNYDNKWKYEVQNEEDYKDCLEKVANGENVDCSQQGMQEGITDGGRGFTDLYNGGIHSKIRTDRFGSFFIPYCSNMFEIAVPGLLSGRDYS